MKSQLPKKNNQSICSIKGFKEYLNKVGVSVEKIQTINDTINHINNNHVSLIDAIDTPMVVMALSNYMGFKNYQSFKIYCGSKHSYPLALLYASSIYKSIPMISVCSVYEIFDLDVVEKLYQHAKSYQQISGSVYDINDISGYGKKRFYSASLNLYKKYLLTQAKL